MATWLHATPSAFHGKRLHRLGLTTNDGIDGDGVRAAMDRGVNLFLWTARGKKGLRSPLREALKTRRDEVAVVGYATIGWFGWSVRHGAEGLRKELGTDRIDVLLLGWLDVGAAWTEATKRELVHRTEAADPRLHRNGVGQAPEAPHGLGRPRDDRGRLLPLPALEPARRRRRHGPASRAQREENLAAVERGPLTDDEAKWSRALGERVHG